MTPKEKAEELYNKMHIEIYNRDMYNDLFRAKQCALIAVDEQLSMLAYMENYINDDMGKIGAYLIYWQEVKQEIEAL